MDGNHIFSNDQQQILSLALQCICLFHNFSDSFGSVSRKFVISSLSFFQSLHIIETILHPGFQLGNIVFIAQIRNKSFPFKDLNIRKRSPLFELRFSFYNCFQNTQRVFRLYFLAHEFSGIDNIAVYIFIFHQHFEFFIII